MNSKFLVQAVTWQDCWERWIWDVVLYPSGHEMFSFFVLFCSPQPPPSPSEENLTIKVINVVTSVDICLLFVILFQPCIKHVSLSLTRVRRFYCSVWRSPCWTDEGAVSFSCAVQLLTALTIIVVGVPKASLQQMISNPHGDLSFTCLHRTWNEAKTTCLSDLRCNLTQDYPVSRDKQICQFQLFFISHFFWP